MTIRLNMKTGLPKVRAALKARKLQASTSWPGESCLYAGPCAIGAMIEPAYREGLDNLDSVDGTGIETLLGAGFVAVPGVQRQDFRNLQAAHDRWAGEVDYPKRQARKAFIAELERLEAKYGVAA